MSLQRGGNDLIEAMRRLGRPIVFYPSLAKMIGIKEAIFLQQLVYWTPKAKNEKGWVYKSAEDWEDETRLTYKEQQRVRETLGRNGHGLIDDYYERSEHRLYFRVIPEAIRNLVPGFEHEAPDQKSDAT